MQFSPISGLIIFSLVVVNQCKLFNNLEVPEPEIIIMKFYFVFCLSRYFLY